MISTPAVVELKHVSKQYLCGKTEPNRIEALRQISLRIEPGEVVGLVGPNRAGKTTLLKIILSLCWPTDGEVTRFGQPAHCRSTLARIGYVHEDQAFPRYLSAAGLLDYFGRLSLLPRPMLKQTIPSLLERVGLADRSRERIARFSKGMIQRLALAQALINDPELLVLDEPSEGLDQNGKHLLYDVVLERRNEGKTTLLVSHLLRDVEQLCDRVGVLVDGKLIAMAPTSQLVRDPTTGQSLSIEQALAALYEETSP